jgi:hypothetical protein
VESASQGSHSVCNTEHWDCTQFLKGMPRGVDGCAKTASDSSPEALLSGVVAERLERTEGWMRS